MKFSKGIKSCNNALLGPTATKAEIWFTWGTSFIAAIILPYLAYLKNIEWSWVQTLVAALLAFDLVGGVVANALNSAKSWWHRKGQGFKEFFAFNALHIHPFFVAWLFRGMDWAYFGVVYGYLLIACIIILKTPLYLQRPVGFILFIIGIIATNYILGPTPGLAWFIPVFYMKLLVAHNIKETAFKP